MYSILTELLLMSNLFCSMDKELLDMINITMPFLTANVQLNLQIEMIGKAIGLFKLKFEESMRGPGPYTPS